MAEVKKEKITDYWKIIKTLAVVFVIAIIVGGIGQMFSSEQDKEATTQLTDEEIIKNKVLDALDEPANVTVNKLRNQYSVIVRYEAPTGWDEASTKRGIDRDSCDVFEAVYTCDYDFEKVDVIAYGKFYDKYGNESIEPAVKIKLEKETAQKINWEHFQSSNLEDVADKYWTHPAMR